MNQKRLNVYISEEDHRKMKAELSRRGLTISEWLRQQIAKFIKDLKYNP